MDGLFFLCSIVGMGLIIFWARQNDKIPMDGPTKGVLAMTDSNEALTALMAKPGNSGRFGTGHPNSSP